MLILKLKEKDMQKNKTLKIILKSILGLFLVVFVLVFGYATYFVASFNRIDDNLALSPTTASDKSTAAVSTRYDLLSWNIGFCTYSDDYSFFMDGGKHGRAFSKEEVNNNALGIQNTVTDIANNKTQDKKIEFICYQEVDYDSTRSYKVDLKSKFTQFHVGYSSTYAQNYNSPYILYPFTEPHGANKSGMLTLSRYQIKSALRRQLPIENSLMKFFDLDRCYSINRFEVNNGKELVLINLHLSAYTSDENVAINQLKMILADCKAEIDKGNYVICAGDFNKDLIDASEGGSAKLFGQEGLTEGWEKSIDPAIFEGTGMTKVAPIGIEQINNAVPTCRNAGEPYSETNRVYMIDGFLVSSNVHVYEAQTIDAQFANSDHNPVLLTFRLIP